MADWSAFFQALTGVGTFLIAWVAYGHSKRSFQLAAMNLYIGNWRALNQMLLESERATRANARLSVKSNSQSDDVSFLILIYINQALLAYYAWRFGALSRNARDEEFCAIWQTVAKFHDHTNRLLHSQSYPVEFKRMFEQVGDAEARKELVNA